ncbi:MAG: hypothetical protein Q9188_001441 [Gyalolechia gomerana]
MSSRAITGEVGKMIDSMRAIAGDGETGELPEMSRQQLLQAAKDLQYNLETPVETCNRAHANGKVISYTTILPFSVDFARFLAQTDYQNPIDSYKTVHQITFDTDMHRFEWMKVHPEHYVILNNFMASNRLTKTGMEIFPFEDKVPYFSKRDQQDPSIALLVDVGGGRGQMCRAFRNRFPELPGRVVVQDLPNTVSSSGKGIEAMPHDFFTPQPVKGAKIYYIRHVLHDWPDGKAESILRNVVDAMDRESIIIIDEKVLPNVGASNVAAGLDLQMMMSYTAQERSEKQWKDLMERVGLKVQELWYYEKNGDDGVMLVLPK